LNERKGFPFQRRAFTSKRSPLMGDAEMDIATSRVAL